MRRHTRSLDAITARLEALEKPGAIAARLGEDWGRALIAGLEAAAIAEPDKDPAAILAEAGWDEGAAFGDNPPPEVARFYNAILFFVEERQAWAKWDEKMPSEPHHEKSEPDTAGGVG
jgi:hypothetical protein